jgi:hypothetical protein
MQGSIEYVFVDTHSVQRSSLRNRKKPETEPDQTEKTGPNWFQFELFRIKNRSKPLQTEPIKTGSSRLNVPYSTP